MLNYRYENILLFFERYIDFFFLSFRQYMEKWTSERKTNERGSLGNSSERKTNERWSLGERRARLRVAIFPHLRICWNYKQSKQSARAWIWVIIFPKIKLSSWCIVIVAITTLESLLIIIFRQSLLRAKFMTRKSTLTSLSHTLR